MKAKDFFSVAKQSFQEWLEDRAPNEAAALAYYALLSVPALLLLIQWILGRVVSDQVQQQVIDFIIQSVQGQGAEALTSMIENADQPGSGGVLATIISLVTLAVSATGIVVHLEQALNRMWEVADEGGGFVAKIGERLSSLLMVGLLGVFLLASVLVSTAVSGFAQTLTAQIPLGEWVLQAINAAISLLSLSVLFGAMFKYVPDARINWSDVWLGAVVTAVLFIIGQYALSLYLGKSAPGSAYGAAGSIVALVVWIYYSAMIMFLGAEFTQVYANRFGSNIRPDEDAVSLEEKIVEEQAQPHREPAADMGEEPGPDERAQRRPQAVDRAERPRRQPGSRHAYGRPIEEIPARPPAGARPYRPETLPPREEEEESYIEYYTVAVLALAMGIWRWFRR